MSTTRLLLGAAVLMAGQLWARSYQVRLFAAAEVYDENPAVLDSKLGFPSRNLLVEAFEDAALIPELKANVQGHLADDTNSLAFTWDGQWPSAASPEQTTFSIQVPGVRVFGIGVGGNSSDAKQELAINSGKPILLSDLPGYVSASDRRAFYLKIEADQGDPDLRTVQLLQSPNVRFDHLVLQTTGEPLRLAPKDPPAIQAQAIKVEESPLPPPARTVAEQKSLKTGDIEQWPSPDAWKRGVPLISKAGKKYLGDQMRFFFVDPEGVITAAKPEWLSLHDTEGKPFRIHGQVWLPAPVEGRISRPDLPEGFALFIREWDSARRYCLTSRGAQVQGRCLGDEPAGGTVQAAQFRPPTAGTWTPFYAEVNWDRITYVFGAEAAILNGPLDVDGANKIAIAPGTRLRDLRLELFDQP